MKHRGAEYKVIQTIVGGWRWSVKIGNREKIGGDFTRENAVRRAKQFIDAGFQKRSGSKAVPQSNLSVSTSVRARAKQRRERSQLPPA